jgi:hypothetical protein
MEVNFNDGKDEDNQISGLLVEGLSGEMTGTDGNSINYALAFSFSGSTGNHPDTFIKTFTISYSTNEINRIYSISNVNTIPDLDSLAMLTTGLLAMGRAARRKAK